MFIPGTNDEKVLFKHQGLKLIMIVSFFTTCTATNFRKKSAKNFSKKFQNSKEYRVKKPSTKELISLPETKNVVFGYQENRVFFILDKKIEIRDLFETCGT